MFVPSGAFAYVPQTYRHAMGRGSVCSHVADAVALFELRRPLAVFHHQVQNDFPHEPSDMADCLDHAIRASAGKQLFARPRNSNKRL